MPRHYFLLYIFGLLVNWALGGVSAAVLTSTSTLSHHRTFVEERTRIHTAFLANGSTRKRCPQGRSLLWQGQRRRRLKCDIIAAADFSGNNLIDGKSIAAEIRLEVAKAVEDLPSPPGLAVILVGDRPDSRAYVRMKKKACEKAGILDLGIDLPSDITEKKLLAQIEAFNQDPRVHGILIQLPLPSHLDERRILEAVDVAKDVDGLHPKSFAALAGFGTLGESPETGAGGEVCTEQENFSIGGTNQNGFSIACTALGCVELLDRLGVSIAGRNAVVVGRSKLVGMPLALLLMRRDATVTIVHSRTGTANARKICREADLLFVAAGKAELVRGDWVKEGAIVVDVGINAVEHHDASGSRDGKRKFVGDVAFDEVAQKASLITPVPGGVGPMTIAMLLRNTVFAAQRVLSSREK